MNDNLLSSVEKYYTNKILEHGPTPRGVDWNGQESQFLRFEILSGLIEKDNPSILDYGCGYGAFYSFLKQKKIKNNFTGFDISKEMIKECKKKYKNEKWYSVLSNNNKYDYVFASGLFNVMLDEDEDRWKEYIFNSIIEFNNLSEQGFAFNLLTTYSDPEKSKDYLFYANPEEMFRFCKNNISSKVTLVHSYPLYEFTIMVKK
ncbi:MAG: class I SAM-dependent methyltransferase [Candidatus Hodarchaeales archaeon]|jgi:cyclopropane fatty-acyl-phospholipid synthase-like methyltransferase